MVRGKPKPAKVPVELKLVQIKGRRSGRTREKILTGLNRFNRVQGGGAPRWKPLCLELKGPQGSFVGGLYGATLWDWLYIELLWLPEGKQGEGWGRALMEKAEAIGRARGCRGAFLSTFSFQAPAFYRHLGYRRIGKLTDMPPGHSRIWFEKHF